MARVALVSGGTRGIGAAISEALVKAGYHVAATYVGNDAAAEAFRAKTGAGVYRIISEGDFLHRVELDIDPPPGNWLEEILGIKEDTPARRRMQARVVREAMSRNPICVSDETTLDEVVALMDMRHVAQLPVVCGTIVVGIIGRVELLRAVARALCPGETDGSGSSAQD